MQYVIMSHVTSGFVQISASTTTIHIGDRAVHVEEAREELCGRLQR